MTSGRQEQSRRNWQNNVLYGVQYFEIIGVRTGWVRVNFLVNSLRVSLVISSEGH